MTNALPAQDGVFVPVKMPLALPSSNEIMMSDNFESGLQDRDMTSIISSEVQELAPIDPSMVLALP